MVHKALKRLTQRSYQEAERRRLARLRSPVDDGVMRFLIAGLRDPMREKKCAQRLLSDYTVYEMGYTVYRRCERAIKPHRTPLRNRVRPKGKPGRMTDRERQEYSDLVVIRRAIQVIDADLTQG